MKAMDFTAFPRDCWRKIPITLKIRGGFTGSVPQNNPSPSRLLSGLNRHPQDTDFRK
jgi:hypothetical protein